MSRLTLDLGSLDSTMLPLVGGKAANLGELIRAGFPVPPGFCVTTEAYRRVADVDFDSLDDARASILGANVPTEIEVDIVRAYYRLGADARVAVRSSATAEDLPHASFAGQQDTYLNVTGAAEVLDAVKRCWASLWTERAIVYRTTNGIDHRQVRLAVVVQRMVDSEVAGVLFTANPLTGKRRQAVIDANPGLGEAVVSGAVNPDHFIVDTATQQIVERRLGDKRLEVRSLPGGGTQHVEKAADSLRASLTDEQVRTLAALGDRVESHFGAPQDIEWAFDADGRAWLTQSRPVTTLFPLPEKSDDLRVHFCFSVAQGLYRPLTPMGLSCMRVIASGVASIIGAKVENAVKGPSAVAEAGGRFFIDITSVLRSSAGRAIAPRVLDIMEARSAAKLRQLFDEPRLAIQNTSWGPFFRGVLRILSRYGVPLRVLSGIISPASARDAAKRMGSELEALRPASGASAIGCLDFIEQVLSTRIAELVPKILPGAAAAFAMLALAGKLSSDRSDGDLEQVLRGLPHNVTTEMDLALWNLARTIRKDTAVVETLLNRPATELARMYREGSLPSCVQGGLARFLSLYGHRAVAEIDVGMPRWADDPSHILGVIANYLRLENEAQAPDAVFARGAAEAESAIERLSDRASLSRSLVRFALNRARELAGLREMPKYNLTIVLAMVRVELLKIGNELAASDRIKSPEDVFFLDLAEVRAALHGRNMRERVARNRQQYEHELRRRHVPTVLLSDGTEPEAAASSHSNSDALVGTPASSGTVTGTARVVLDPVGARIEPGEILVARSTDPGWTPLFLTAGGLIMEMGGANSHGAVVAREYGIPAVVGVAEATLRISSGQRITMDGARGAVTLDRPEHVVS